MNKILPYNSELHRKILEALRNRVKRSSAATSRKTSDYTKDEERFRAYIPETEADRLRRADREKGKPKYTTLEVPYSYAMLMSYHTYLCSVFLSRSPLMQFQGRHGQTDQQIQAVEAIMDYQVLAGEHLAPYFIWLLDKAKYGVGIIGNYWDEEFTQVSEIVEEDVTYLGYPTGEKQKVKRTRRIPAYEGNKVFNVRPQDFIFDSRVSLLNFQRGEFCGNYSDLSWNTIMQRKEHGQYYNIEKLRAKMKRRGSSNKSDSMFGRDEGSDQMTLPDAITGDQAEAVDDSFMTPGFTEVIELQVRLIPKDWNLGSSTYPEIWHFTVADGDLIIESAPAPNFHGKFSYNIIEYEMEGYALHKRSMMEILDPLQNAMTWLLNTHFYNVRHILNGQFVVDPSRLTMKDFKSEDGGRLIRAKPAAFGTDLRTAFEQLQTVDVTQNHLRDMNIVGELMQRVCGVTDNIMGAVNPGGRKTATEIRSSNSSGSNRLKIQAEYASAMGFAPHAMQLLQNTQQFYDGEDMFRLAGDLMIEGSAFTEVTPERIAGAYDFVPVDGSQPVDRFAQVTMWTQLMAQLRNMPQVEMQYDLARVFAWVAQLGGLKNIHRFKLNVVPDEVAVRNAQAGRTLPIGGPNDGQAIAGTNTGRVTSRTGNTSGVPGAPQFPGVGRPA